MNTRHSITRFLSLAAAAAFFAAVQPQSAHAGEPCTNHARVPRHHHAHPMNYVSEPAQPVIIKAQPAPAKAETLNDSDFRSFDENNLVNPG